MTDMVAVWASRFNSFAFALKSNGHLWARGDSAMLSAMSASGADLFRAKSISGGQFHVMAVHRDNDGSFIVFGWNNIKGQFNVPNPRPTDVTAVAAGVGHSVVISGGKVIQWGDVRPMPDDLYM
jgi:alpha-tubulin suppressor-like RCC1 family protein